MEVVLCMLAERGILKILTANNATFQAAFDSSKHKEERIVNGAAKIIEVTNLRELQLRPKYVNKRGNKLKDFMSSTQFSAISTNECFRYSGGLDVSAAGYLRHCQFHHKSFSSRSLKSRCACEASTAGGKNVQLEGAMVAEMAFGENV
uniref:RNase III domain-containing protein n=1 Tax=Ascaris lumbricoides TaxID=6252 RepID=A0A0M3IMB3_ASCLU